MNLHKEIDREISRQRSEEREKIKKEILNMHKDIFDDMFLSPSENRLRCEIFTNNVMVFLFAKDRIKEAKKNIQRQWDEVKDHTNYTKEEYWKLFEEKPNNIFLVKKNHE